MATKRIKDLTNTAASVASDAYLAIDGTSNGTEKITRDNFRQDTADAFVAAPGTYNLAPLVGGAVEVDKGGTGATTVDTAKTNLQIPDIGTGANEVPLNGMLGTMAFQSSEGPNVSNLNANGKTSLTNDSDISLSVETTNQNAMVVNVSGASPNYIFDVRDDGSSKFRVDGNGNVVIGNIPTSASGLASGTVWSDSGTLKIIS